jgi:signal peptidase I
MRRHDPDALTSRELEVLALVRLGLTNEEIAGRLGITLDGAKYHVSQILSKFGVATREEAAAVALATWRPWWLRVGVWAKIGGAAAVFAAVGGLAVLAWGLVRTADTSEDVSPESDAVQTPPEFFRVEGAGMEPTFTDGTLVEVMSFGDAEPERGDVVVFRSPLFPEREFVKRIIGLPGETIEINEATNEVIVDGSALTEPYARTPTTCFTTCFVTVPAANSEESFRECGSGACFFVLGDNRPNSSDSRQGWLVPDENIVGRVEDPAAELQVTWERAVELINSCDVQAAAQAHSRDVMLTLKDGTRLYTVEPELDDVFPVVFEARERCGDIQLVTE